MMIPFKIFSKKGNEGSALVEFILVFTLLLALSLPPLDYGRLVLTDQHITKAASFAADAVALSRPIEDDTTQFDIDTDGSYITPQALSAIVSSMNVLMSPFPAEQPGGQDLYQIVITHVYRGPDGTPRLGWQYDLNSQSFYSSARQSSVGVVTGPASIGTPAVLPPSLATTLDEGENLIVAEVSAFFQPITPNLGALGIPALQSNWRTYTAYYRARYGNLKCVWGVYMPPTPECAPVPGAPTGPFGPTAGGGSSSSSSSSSSSGGAVSGASSSGGGSIAPGGVTSAGG